MLFLGSLRSLTVPALYSGRVGGSLDRRLLPVEENEAQRENRECQQQDPFHRQHLLEETRRAVNLAKELRHHLLDGGARARCSAVAATLLLGCCHLAGNLDLEARLGDGVN